MLSKLQISAALIGAIIVVAHLPTPPKPPPPTPVTVEEGEDAFNARLAKALPGKFDTDPTYRQLAQALQPFIVLQGYNCSEVVDASLIAIDRHTGVHSHRVRCRGLLSYIVWVNPKTCTAADGYLRCVEQVRPQT